MFEDQIYGDDSLIDIFQGDNSHIRFINSSSVLAILCEQARSSLKIVECNYPQDTHQVQVNINIEKFIYGTALNQCPEMIGTIAYACKTCRIIQAPIYLCYSCFQNGEHVKKKHETEMIHLPKQIVDKLQCHCGDKTFINRNGTCLNHCSSRKQFDEFTNSADYLEFKQFIVDCFKIYFQLLGTREHFENSSEIYKLSEYYKSELMQCINNILYQNNPQNIRFMSDCLSTITTKKCANGYEQKISIIIHLLDNNLITSQFYHIFHQLVREDYFYLSSKVFSYIATSYIKLHIGISQKQNLDDKDTRQIKKKIYYLQDLLNQFVIGADSSERICNLAVNNQILNSQYLFNKSYRMIIMKFYCFLIKAIVINNKDTHKLKQFFKQLNKNNFLYLFFIQQGCLPHFLLCSMSDENSFMQLLVEIQKSLASKKNQPNLNLVHCICQVFLISHLHKINTVHKYLAKSKFPVLVSLIKNSESNQNLKGQINQNLKNLCFNLRQILNNQNILIQQLKKEQEQVQNKLVIYQQINNTSQQTQIKAQKIAQNLSSNQKNVTTIKQKIKTQQQIAIQKKKQKLHQKFARKGKNFMQKFKIQNKMSQQHICGICRQQNQENKQLFMMGKIYNRNKNLSQIVKINKTQKYIDVCKHIFHVQCILKSYKANNSLQSKCPLCKQSINIGFLIQDQELTEKGEVQFIQLLNLSKQLQDKQTQTLFPDLLLAAIQEKYQQIIFKVEVQQKVEKQCIKTNQLQMKQSKNQLVFQIVLKNLRELYSRFNKKNILQIQQIILKNSEIFPQKNLCLNKIFYILLLGTFASIQKAQNLFLKIILQLSQLYQILQSRQVQKIILSLPKNIIEIINSRKNLIKNIGNSNKKISHYLCNLPKNIAQFYNNFKPPCNRTRLHFKNYCYCLICDQIYCSECKSKQAQHKSLHQIKNFLILSTGQLNVHIKQQIKTYKIYMSRNNKLNSIQNQLKQFDSKLYVSIVQELVKSLKVRTGN